MEKKERDVISSECSRIKAAGKKTRSMNIDDDKSMSSNMVMEMEERERERARRLSLL
jgi:hypothetical protein